VAKRALITGITGQDGSYLTELLLENGARYTVLLYVRVPLIPDDLNTYLETLTILMLGFSYITGTCLGRPRIEKYWGKTSRRKYIT
jgi:hypothetical protein